jgi:CRP-like cAMP-binding protein
MNRKPATTAIETRYALIEKLRRYVDLDNEEVGALTRLLTRTQRIPRGRDIVVQGQPYRSLYVLNEGLALRYKVLSDGRRQVLNLIVPGDMIGLPACLFEGSIASISGLTDTTISPIKFEELFGLFRHYPRISAALFWTSAREAGIYVERLATIGRRSAYERLAHLILELLSRLQVVGQAIPNSFELPLTQEMLADTLGLSLQHVNRMIRNLREEGLASIEEHKVTIHDMESLVRLAGFEDTYLSRYKIPGLSR